MDFDLIDYFYILTLLLSMKSCLIYNHILQFKNTFIFYCKLFKNSNTLQYNNALQIVYFISNSRKSFSLVVTGATDGIGKAIAKQVIIQYYSQSLFFNS